MSDKFQMREVNKNTLKLYWRQIRKYKIWLVLSFFVPISGLLIDTFLPFTLSQAVGALTVGNKGWLDNSLMMAVIVTGAGVLANLIGFQSLIRLEAKVRESLINETFEEIIHKDYSFFVHTQIGALTTRFLDFVKAEISLQDLFFVKWVGFILSLSFGIIIIASQSWLLALFILVFIILLLAQIKWSFKKREGWRKERHKIRGELFGALADAVTNNVVVKTFSKEESERKKLGGFNKSLKGIFIKDIGFMSKEGTARHLFMASVQILAIGGSAYLVFNGAMEIAFVIFTLAYLQRIASQLFILGEMINGIDQAFLEAAPMTEMLMRNDLVQDKKGAKNLQVKKGEIDFIGVDYRYNDGNVNVLSDVTLHIPSGQRLGLIGYSGAGKTTITHLLLRFADVTKGSLLIDGQDIKDITQESLRKNIAYVSQEPLLFHRSVRENIAYGSMKNKVTEKEILLAAKQAHALEFIETLPNGLDTVVGERGVKLSGGQRQRVAIARAILKNAPILILDEATSALDSESEKLIQEALGKLMRDKTTLVIAHRLSTIAKLDRLLVLNKGKIVEEGSHAELLKHGGIYAKLWEHQSGGFIQE